MSEKSNSAAVAVGKKVPAFVATAVGVDSGKVSLSDYRGSILLLYFYPRDHTPGCTTESSDFAASYNKFRRAGCYILGASRDNPSSHRRFIDKLSLPFPLLADNEEQLCNMFGVMVNKNMYGKKVRGIERSTFLIDGKGVLRQEWRKLKVEGHVEEALAAVKSIGK
ncbi:MAG: peroxiredoxin [Candidatus Porifericomitaceae bacterium WSBS_2022_MAG_OTU9]